MQEEYSPTNSFTGKVVDRELDGTSYDLTFGYSEDGEGRKVVLEGLSPEEIVELLEDNDIWAPVSEFDEGSEEISSNYDVLTGGSNGEPGVSYEDQWRALGRGGGSLHIEPSSQVDASYFSQGTVAATD